MPRDTSNEGSNDQLMVQSSDKGDGVSSSPRPHNKKKLTDSRCAPVTPVTWHRSAALVPSNRRGHLQTGRTDNDVKNYWNSTLRAKSEARRQSFLWMYATKVNAVCDNAAARAQAFRDTDAIFSGAQWESEESEGDVIDQGSSADERSGLEGIMLLATECEAALAKEQSVGRATKAPFSSAMLNQTPLSSTEEELVSWGAEEELALATHHCEIGGNWSQLSAHLPGRSCTEVEEFWGAVSCSRNPARALTFLGIYATKVAPVSIYASRRKNAFEEAKSAFLSVQRRLRPSTIGSSSASPIEHHGQSLSSSVSLDAAALSHCSNLTDGSALDGHKNQLNWQMELFESAARFRESYQRSAPNPLKSIWDHSQSGMAPPRLKRKHSEMAAEESERQAGPSVFQYAKLLSAQNALGLSLAPSSHTDAQRSLSYLFPPLNHSAFASFTAPPPAASGPYSSSSLPHHFLQQQQQPAPPAASRPSFTPPPPAASGPFSSSSLPHHFLQPQQPTLPAASRPSFTAPPAGFQPSQLSAEAKYSFPSLGLGAAAYPTDLDLKIETELYNSATLALLRQMLPFAHAS
eukprot:gene1336-32693_t